MCWGGGGAILAINITFWVYVLPTFLITVFHVYPSFPVNKWDKTPFN